ncbi:MAG: hypothetical protein AB1714_14710 [Acidobacteriota bacterium]
MLRILLSALASLSMLLVSASWIVAQPQPPGPPAPPEPRMEEAALKFVQTYHPSRAEDLKRMRAQRPEEYNRVITDIWHRTQGLAALQRDDPARYDLEIRQETLEEKSFVLAQKYRAAKDEREKQDIRKQVEAAVNEQFEVREQMKEADVKRMEAELQQVKEKLKQRRANQSEIVKRRVDQLLSMGEGLEWD